MNIFDKILFGLEVALIGLVVVFLVLIILIYIIKLLGVIAGKIEKAGEAREERKAARLAEKKEAEAKAPAPRKEAPKPAAPVQQAQPAAPADDAELIAVLSAACAAMMGTSASRVRISSYKKTNTRSIWATAGRREQIASRF